VHHNLYLPDGKKGGKKKGENEEHYNREKMGTIEERQN